VSDKPLHVAVAEALGCEPEWDEESGYWLCSCADEAHVDPEEHRQEPPIVWNYDTDWSATGPLVELFKIEIFYREPSPHLDAIFGDKQETWGATHDFSPEPQLGACYESTPLIAVCNLILALHAAGKLQPLLSAPASAK
jgi:hypothetical protein